MRFPNLQSNGVPPVFKNELVRFDKADTLASVEKSGVRAEFEKIAEKTPAERMREALLKRLGHTEESLKALPPEERDAIERQMQELIKQEAQTAVENRDRAGRVADLLA